MPNDEVHAMPWQCTTALSACQYYDLYGFNLPPHTARLATIILTGNTKRGSINVLLTSCLPGLESAVWQLTFFVFICKTDLSIPVKQEVNGTVILPLKYSLALNGLAYYDGRKNIYRICHRGRGMKQFSPPAFGAKTFCQLAILSTQIVNGWEKR